jgi:hypothetical protein
MPRKYRDAYNATVKGAIPENEDEAFLFELARKEEDRELLAEDIAAALAKRKPKGGAPRKTVGDAKLAAQLVEKHSGVMKSARAEFIRIVAAQDGIEKKRARARFKDALEDLKTR